jgi:predicted DNA-binding protein
MSHTTTIRLTEELAEWLDEVVAKTGLSRSKIIRDQLEKARNRHSLSFMKLAGTVRGPKDLSSRKGFSRS